METSDWVPTSLAPWREHEARQVGQTNLDKPTHVGSSATLPAQPLSSKSCDLFKQHKM